MEKPVTQTKQTVTDIREMFDDLDGGVFAQKLGRAVSDVAMGVVDTGKTGKITITLDVKQIGDSQQVNIKHKLSYKRPTKRGDFTENNMTETPMYVNQGGEVSLFPKAQSQLFSKTDAPASTSETR